MKSFTRLTLTATTRKCVIGIRLSIFWIKNLTRHWPSTTFNWRLTSVRDPTNLNGTKWLELLGDYHWKGHNMTNATSYGKILQKM